MIGSEDCLRNDLSCVGFGVKLYSIQSTRKLTCVAFVVAYAPTRGPLQQILNAQSIGNKLTIVNSTVLSTRALTRCAASHGDVTGRHRHDDVALRRCVKPCPHCRRKVRQSHFSATVWTGLYIHLDLPSDGSRQNHGA